MAYANLVNQNCAGGTEEVFQRIRDFICKRNGTYDYSATGIGWTLHDSYYATDEDNCAIGDWFVIKSVGESPGKDDLYYRFKWHEVDHINIQGMLYWNAATDTAVLPYNTASVDPIYVDDDAAVVLWIYGDLDRVVSVTKLITGIYYGANVGKAADLPYDTTIATCSGSLSSGSDISITVDDIPSEWAVDRYLFIRDNAHIEKIKIKTLNAGTKTITADLTNSYTANNKLAADLVYMVSGNQMMGSSKYLLINHNGAMYTYATPVYNATVNNCYPDKMNDEPIAGPELLRIAGIGYHGSLGNVMRIAGNIPGLSSEDVLTDFDSVDWRVFMLHSSTWHIIKEV